MARAAAPAKTSRLTPKQKVLAYNKFAFLNRPIYKSFYQYEIIGSVINWPRVGYGTTPRKAWENAVKYYKEQSKHDFLEKLES